MPNLFEYFLEVTPCLAPCDLCHRVTLGLNDGRWKREDGREGRFLLFKWYDFVHILEEIIYRFKK